MSAIRPLSDQEVVKRRIQQEQVALMCRLTTLPLFGSIGVGAILAYLAVEDHGLLVSLGWYVAAIVIMLVRWRVAGAFLRHRREHDEFVRWRTLMFVLIVLFGVIWSIPAGVLLPENPRKETLMSVVFIGATATGLGSLASVRHAYAALLIPFVMPYGITQLMSGGDRILLGLAVFLYLPVMILVAKRQTDAVERQIALSIENESLVEALRCESDRVNAANRELEAQLAQQRLSAERIRLLNENLELRAAELRTANDDLEGFSYSVSHDLRTPLRAIDGFASLIAQATATADPQLKRHFDRIHENIRRMSRLIDDLLAFSRLGRRPIEMLDLRMDELARDAVSEACMARSINLDSIELEIGSLPCARGDRGLMLQVWINLLDNALKYTGKVARPSIVISGREDADFLVYEVNDNGVGFDSRYSDKLFGVFERLHAVSEYPGSGVGLAIVQRIVKRHGGVVWARSELDQGATFGFSLPKPNAGQAIAVSA